MLTRLNAISGVESSFAFLANNGNRMVQIRIRPGANRSKVVEEVQRALRAEVRDETPVQLESKPDGAFGQEQDWLSLGQLNALAMEESSSRSFDIELLLFALIVVIALCAFLFWLCRRGRNEQTPANVPRQLPVRR